MNKIKTGKKVEEYHFSEVKVITLEAPDKGYLQCH